MASSTLLPLAVVTLAMLGCSSPLAAASCPRIVCYYTNWSQYRPEGRKFFPEDIDATKCTHINYAFAKLEGNQLAPFEWNDDSEEWMTGMYERFYNHTKSQNPSVQLLLSVGGWNMGSEPFTAMVATPENRLEFATTSVAFLRKRGFDGLDLDWEYPANRNSPPEDKSKYVELLKILKSVYDEDAKSTGRPRLLLTAAVAAGKNIIDTGYDVPSVAKQLDFINIMSYDFHGGWSAVTGHNSPLFADSSEVDEHRYLNIDWAARYWADQGTPKHKLVIGLATYGRSFTLESNSNTGLGVPVKGAGTAGQYTREAGFLAYYEICELIKNGASIHYLKDQQVPYLVSGDQWVGYDDEQSLINKVRYVMSNGYGGVMFWNLDLDDFTGSCGKVYPLVTAIATECQYSPSSQGTPHSSSTESTAATTGSPTTPAASTTASGTTPTPTVPVTTSVPTHNPGDGAFCSDKASGLYPNPDNCNEFYMCAEGSTFKKNCDSGLVFNPKINACDWSYNYDCKVTANTPASSTTPTLPVTTSVPSTAATTSPTSESTTLVVTTVTSSTTTPQPHATDKDLTEFCRSRPSGLYPHPNTCTKYIQCDAGTTHIQACAPGTVFNPKTKTLDFPANVPGC